MKNILKFVIIGLVFVAGLIAEEDKARYNLVFSLYGQHYENNEYYNNSNEMFGIERLFKNGNSIMLTTFENSYNVRSYAVMYNHRFRVDKRVRPLISVGLCKGYEEGIRGNYVIEDGRLMTVRHEPKFNHLTKDYSIVGYLGLEFEFKKGYTITVASTHNNVAVMMTVKTDWGVK